MHIANTDYFWINRQSIGSDILAISVGKMARFDKLFLATYHANSEIFLTESLEIFSFAKYQIEI